MLSEKISNIDQIMKIQCPRWYEFSNLFKIILGNDELVFIFDDGIGNGYDILRTTQKVDYDRWMQLGITYDHGKGNGVKKNEPYQSKHGQLDLDVFFLNT